MQNSIEEKVLKSKSRHRQLKSDAKISWYTSHNKISSRWSITCANRVNSSKDSLSKVKMHQMRSIGIQKLLKRTNFLTKKTKLDLNTWVHSPIRLIKRKWEPLEPERSTPRTWTPKPESFPTTSGTKISIIMPWREEILQWAQNENSKEASWAEHQFCKLIAPPRLVMNYMIQHLNSITFLSTHHRNTRITVRAKRCNQERKCSRRAPVPLTKAKMIENIDLW